MIALSSALLLVALQSPDTAATKRALLEADRFVTRTTGAVLLQLEPGAPVFIPGQPILRGADEARGPFEARYGDGRERPRYRATPLHAVVSSDGLLGCTTGASTVIVLDDSLPRYGRYLTCWRRQRLGASWMIALLARAGESQPDQDANVLVSRWPHSAIGPTVGLGGALDADELFARVAMDTGPGPAFGRFAAIDGMLLGARPVPPLGPDSIRARFSGFPADQRLMWAPIRDLGVASGGLAITVGEATTGPPGGTPVSFSKYATVWRLEPDGTWRFVFDMGSVRPARD